ncbi:nuclear pore complex protein Nup160 homolog isoform X7 [Nasonia vitripennis]|uniref:Nuclear pore complex protein Nup160 homolog n=1 Tax=Nasonia vitripennis TaxID=7425 RepID=A0A7M7Q616_NASVI|nr:nuclear pore complex protein Nup160 homolog isoform X7 [Nasonia vitripennis]
MDYILGYREVIPDQTLPEKWKEIILNTGGSQSTLQDIKVPERAGGYSYKNPSRYITRNRFIYWRITHDVIELVEESLDINLINNRVRYKFTDTPILDGISIHETSEIVIILIITVSSIHKLSFTHPNKTYKEEQTVVSHVDRTMQSIFSEASIHKARDPHTFYIIPSSGSTNPPVAHAGSSCLTVHQDKAVFALAYNSGVILVLRLDIVTGTVNFSELKQESTVPRFLSGIATAFRSRTLENEIATSLVLHTHNNNVYLFSISRGGYLRMWSCNEAQYVTGIDLAINNRDSIRNIQNCLLKNSIILHHEIYLCTYIKYITGCEFAILKVVKDAGFLKFIRHCTIDALDFTDLDFKSGLLHILENIKDIASAMAMLLEFMTYNLSQPNPSKLRTSDGIDKTTLANSEFLFGSDLGTSTIAESVTQIAVLRFSMCRNLLILQNIILSRSEILDSYSLHTIKSSLAPRTVVLTQAYYVIMWISETSTSVVPSQSLVNASAQRLLLLKLFGATPHTQHQNRSFTILELFVKYGAKHQIYDLIDHSNSYSSNLKLWHNGLLSYINTISQLIWPISGNFEFPEWLLKSCQFLLVQEYVRLLSTWCEWNSASRKFILAVSLLEVGETEKACDYFLRASNGVLVDSFLSSLITSSNTASDSSALVLYYLKVIEIFEQHNAFDCIIELAMTAIAVAETNEPNLPTLHSIVFTQHLHLQHHIEAYNCLNTNPDNQRRVDCLRLLVLALFNRKKLIELASFPYVDMYTDLEKIMESRARSADLLENNYYDFLYSFHINKGNIRKAASIMYEQAIRLGQESYSLLTISKITHCLLSCINALHLVNEKYRWIVRPVMHANSSEEEKNLTKNRSELEEEILQFNLKKQIEVLELKDIKKEYILAEAKLKLIKFNPDHCLATQTCPSEIAAALCSAGLYLKALQICECYKLCKIIVIESLTSQCIKYCKKDATKVWKWLHRDNINDFGVSTLNAVDMSWNVLKHFTLTQENYGESILHKEVSRKLYHRGLFLPQWLLSSYAKRNPAELLRLMILMGRLEEAAYFSIEYIKGHLGKGTEYFGLKTPLIATGPSVCLPCNILEILLIELEHASKEDEAYKEIHKLLQDTLIKYFKTVKRVSEDMIRIKTRNY